MKEHEIIYVPGSVDEGCTECGVIAPKGELAGTHCTAEDKICAPGVELPWNCNKHGGNGSDGDWVCDAPAPPWEQAS